MPFKALIRGKGSRAAFSNPLYLIVNDSLAILKRDKDRPYYNDATFGVGEVLAAEMQYESN